MAEKRKRSQNYTLDEKDKLVKILCTYKDTILNKRTDGTTNEAKIAAWTSVTAKFNSSGSNFRTKESLMKLWEKMKSEAKLYSKNIKEGGGPNTMKIDPVMEQVCNIMGRDCTGIIGIDDSDADRPVINSVIPLPVVPQNSTASVESAVLENMVIQLNNEEVVGSDVTNAVDNNNCSTSQITPVNSNNISEIMTSSPTPMWSRRQRPQVSHSNEASEAVMDITESYTNLNRNKHDTEKLKRQLLIGEINFKQKLYKLQLEAAEKELEIKNEILNQLKDGRLAAQQLFGPLLK